MITSDQRSDILHAIHSISLLNFSAVLSKTSQSEFFVMSAIEKLQKLHGENLYGISGIADSLHVSSPAISRTITSLENKGYVVRYTDKLNRRSTGVRLTTDGEVVYRAECERLHGFINSVAERMGEDKVNELLSLSNELLMNIESEINVKQNELN